MFKLIMQMEKLFVFLADEFEEFEFEELVIPLVNSVPAECSKTNC